MLHLSEGGPLRLRFDYTSGLPTDKQQVVDSTMALLQDELTNSHPRTSADVGVVSLLHKPASKDQLPIDLDSGPRLACEVVMIDGAHGAEDTGCSRSQRAVTIGAAEFWPQTRCRRDGPT